VASLATSRWRLTHDAPLVAAVSSSCRVLSTQSTDSWSRTRRQHLSLGGNRLGRSTRRTWTRRKRINHFAWPRVMQLFASLMFDRIWVVLQPVDMPLQQVILPLQTMQLAIQRLRILPLLLIHGKPILPKDDVIPHRQCKQRSSTRCYFSPTHPTSLIQTNNGARPLCSRSRIVQRSHLDLSTNSTSLTVKWKTLFVRQRT
jgi:hypothetical protein